MKRSQRAKNEEKPPLPFPERYADLVLFALLYVAILYVFRASIFFGRTAGSADAVSQAAVFGNFAIHEIFEHHRYPLWFPHIFCGMPFFSSMTWVEVYPPSVIMRFLGHYLGFGFTLSNSLHFLLGGIAVFYVARNLKLSRASSFISAVAFVFSTGVITMEHGTRIITAMYLPLIFLLVKKALEERRFNLLVWAGIAGGFQILGNHIQVVFYTWLLVGLYVLYYWIIPGLFSPPSWKLPKALLRVVAVGVMAAVVGAVLLFSLREYTPYSGRSFAAGTQEGYQYATSWSFSPFELLEFFLPSIAGFASPTYWGSMPFTHAPIYVGVIVCMLVSLALAFRRNKDVWFLVLVAVVAVLLSFGRNFGSFYNFVYDHVPLFSRFRIPVLILVLCLFSFALLSGFGTECVLWCGRARGSKGRKTAGRVRPEYLIIAWILLSLAVPFYLTGARDTFVDKAVHPTADRGVSFAELGLLKANRYEMALDDAWRSFGFVSMGGVVLLLFLWGRLGRKLFAAFLAFLIAVDLVLIAGRVIKAEYPKQSIDEYYERERQTPLVQFLMADSTLYRILPLGGEMTTNKYAYFGISSVGGYHAVKMGLYERMTKELGFPRNLNLLHMMNTKYVISPGEIRFPIFEKVLTTDQGYVYKNLMCLPRFYTVDSVTAVTNQELCFPEMKKQEFDPSRYAVVVADHPVRLDEDARADLSVTQYDIHKIGLDAVASGRCFLVMSETFYPPGWRAFVNGEEREIIQTNYLFRGLILEPGENKVTLEYNGALFNAGLHVSVWGLLVLFAYLIAEQLVLRHRRRTAS